MKKLTYKQILDYLKKEDILYKIIEDEDAEGKLEITGIELNTISGIIRDLREKRQSLDELIRELKRKIKSKAGGVYFEKLDRVFLEDQIINFQKDCYFLDCSRIVITSCRITSRRKKIDFPAMITLLGQSKKT